MGYVRTAGMSTAARRSRRRAALVISAVLVALLIALGLSMAYVQGWLGADGGDTDEAAVTTAAPDPALDPSEVVVNIFNATARAGLAGQASEDLSARSFTVDGVGNASSVIEGSGQIVHGPAGLEGAELLAESIGQDIELVPDEREDSTLDLVLGDAWEDLGAPDDSAESDG